MQARLGRLEQMLANMSLAPRQRARSRSRSRSRSRARNMQQAMGGVGSSQAVVKLTSEEILCTLQAATDTFSKVVSIRPGGEGNSAAHISALAKIYERMQWHSVQIHYVSSVGTTVGGSVAIGIDWDADKANLTLANVAAMTPSRQFPAHSAATLTIPAAALSSQRWYSTENDTEAPHPRVCIYAAGGDLANKGFGYLRISYSVSFAGFKAP